MVVITVIVTLTTYCISYVYSKSNYGVCEFTVCEGDTLWDIADVHLDESRDIREYIWEIEKLNGLESAFLKPGDVLLIPIYE